MVCRAEIAPSWEWLTYFGWGPQLQGIPHLRILPRKQTGPVKVMATWGKTWWSWEPWASKFQWVFCREVSPCLPNTESSSHRHLRDGLWENKMGQNWLDTQRFRCFSWINAPCIYHWFISRVLKNSILSTTASIRILLWKKEDFWMNLSHYSCGCHLGSCNDIIKKHD